MGIRRRVFFVICAGLFSTLSLHTVGYSQLRFGVKPAEYFDLIYDQPNLDGPIFVYFTGEPIKLAIDIFNSTQMPELAVTQASQPAAVLGFKVTKENTPVDVALVVDTRVRRSGRFGSESMDWARQMPLDPGETLTIRVDVSDTQLPVGVYTVDVTVEINDEESRILRPQASRYQFEVRE